MDETDVQDVYRRAEMYEAVYRGRGKDYAREAKIVTGLVRDRAPGARRLLDVACGTGAHLSTFAAEFDDVAGLDLSEDMLHVARRRLPAVPLRAGDMRDFDLGRTFDAVTCMFSSVGYLADGAELDATLASLARHLEPGGVAVVEPWWSPDTFLPGHVQGDAVTVDGLTVSRVSHSVLLAERPASRMEIHWVVAEPDAGIQHHSEVHVMTLFSRQEYLTAFERAGFSAAHVRHELGGPGLFVGVLDRN